KAAPIVIGLRFRWPLDASRGVVLLLGLLAGCAALCATAYTLARLFAPLSRPSGEPEVDSPWRRVLAGLGASPRQRWNDAFPLILGVVVVLLFWRGPVTNASVHTYVYPERYVVPLSTALMLLLARLFSDIGTWSPGSQVHMEAPLPGV